MAEIDLVKKLNTTDVTDMDSRFVEVDDFLETSTSTPKNDNTILFSEVSDIIKSVPTSSIDSFIKDVEELSSDEKLVKAMTDTLGYIPSTIDDVNKAIDATTEELTKIIFEQANDILSPITESIDTAISEVSDLEQDTLNYLGMNNSLLRSTYRDPELDSLNKTLNSYLNDSVTLVSSVANDISSFITDPLSSDYLSDILNSEELESLTNDIDKVLKYTTTSCDDMADLVRTGIYDISSVISSLNSALNKAIGGSMPNLLSDLMNCFDRLYDTVNQVELVNETARKIGSTGNTELLSVAKDFDIDQTNPEKLLYYSILNDDDPYSHQDEINEYKSTFDIDTDIYLKYPQEYTEDEIYDIITIKSNPDFANVCSSSYDDKESSSNPEFLATIPTSILV